MISFIVVLGGLALLYLMNAEKVSMSTYHSLQERRMSCGRIIRREVIQEQNEWHKTVTLLDLNRRVIATKTRTIEPEQCNQIQAGLFVPGLWRDCSPI